jgi:2-amino-4-hydroxy-6-hydroxymethyldihydropteridine diphosphokinase
VCSSDLHIKTNILPGVLIILLNEIEIAMGKAVEFRYGPRIIDIDVLLCDDMILHSETLQIPHPFMHQREFVLKPLIEIAPNLVHPVLNKPISQLYQELS